MADAKELDLTRGSIGRQLLLFFLPIFLGSFFQQFYNSTDALIVGQFVGKEALAAIESTASLTRLLVQFFIGVSSGATILVSQAFGAKDGERVSRTVHTAIAFALAGGVLVTLIGLLGAPACLRAMHVPKEIEHDAIVYTRIFFLGVTPTFLYSVGAAILRAVGDSRRPFYYLIFSCIVNIILDIVFVLVFRLGVAGAGVATLVSQALSAALVFRTLCRSGAVYRVILRNVKVYRDILKRILLLGLPIGLQSAMYSFSNILIQARVNEFGTDMVAAWAVSGKVDFLIWILLDALTISISTFVAQNYGARLVSRVEKGVRTAIGVGFLMFIPLSVALYVFAPWLARIFVADQQVIDLTVSLLHFFAPVYWLYIVGDVYSGAIRGTGDSILPMILTFIGTCLVRIIWLLVLPSGSSIWSIILCYPVTWGGTSLLYIVYGWMRGGVVKRQDR